MGTVQIIKSFASIAQLVECSLGKAEVTGSIPVRSPRKKGNWRQSDDFGDRAVILGTERKIIIFIE